MLKYKLIIRKTERTKNSFLQQLLGKTCYLSLSYSNSPVSWLADGSWSFFNIENESLPCDG